MAEALSALFDGELHWLEPDEHFSAEGARLVLAGFEPIENDDLSPFETEAEASYDDKPALYKHDNKPVEADLEQSWGSLSIELSAFASICGFDKKQYQHKHNVKGVPSEWSFQTTGFVAERM